MSDDTVVRANGVDLCVETIGAREDPAVLLIHGAGDSMLGWDDAFCDRLAAGRRFVVRYDSRDAGRSIGYDVGSPLYDLRDLVEDALGVLDALEVTGAHVVGMSQGAAVGQLMGIGHPARVSTLTLASSTPGGPGHDQPDLPPMSAELGAYFTAAPVEPDWSDRDAVIEFMVDGQRPFAAPTRPFDADAVRVPAGRTFDWARHIAAQLINPFLIDAGTPWRDRLSDIAAPTLIFHGTDDPLFPYPHAVALAAEIPGARLIPMELTGHETFPPDSWDTVVPAILAHTAQTDS